VLGLAVRYVRDGKEAPSAAGQIAILLLALGTAVGFVVAISDGFQTPSPAVVTGSLNERSGS